MIQPRILFVDDEPRVLDALRRALRPKAQEWQMTFLASPKEALGLAGSEPFDVVVTDLHMPGLDGLAMLEKLKAGATQASCIVLTGTGDLEAAMDAINRIGVFRFYSKPCPTDRLIEGIAAALRARHPDSDTGKEASLAARTALDRLPFAVLALDSQKHVIFMNRSGALLVQARRGLSVDAGGQCRALRPEVTRVLHDAIDKVLAGTDTAALTLPLASEDNALSLLVSAGTVEDGDAKVLLFVQDRNQAAIPPADHLRSLFGLTNAEAELARALVQGRDLAEAAQDCGLTINSARTYLKSVFSKTGTNRQANLVRLLLSVPVGLS